MTNIFFTADTHFNHSKIIEYCNRPFSCVEEMNETLVENWNRVVKRNDVTYHLGDSVFGNPRGIIQRLNGKKILIKGNHDNFGLSKAMRYGFSEVHNLLITKINRNSFTLCHYPMCSWYRCQGNGIHLHGHLHGNELPFKNGRMDVGVDCNDLTPFSYEQVMETLGIKYEEEYERQKTQNQ